MRSNSIDLMLSEVGDSIRKLRLQYNLSQGVVAERSGISFGAYRNLESGQGASLRSFLAVCRTLGKTVGAIVPYSAGSCAFEYAPRG